MSQLFGAGLSGAFFLHSTIIHTRRLLWLWLSPSPPVERASVTAIADLVLTGESIIANERLAWTSTATARDEGAKETEKPPEVAEPGRGGAGGRNAQIKPV